METKKYLSDLHKEHVDWSEHLNFFKDEIGSFKHKLEEIVTNNSETRILAQVEHFQNQFIRQEEVIDELMHEINVEEDKVVRNAKGDVESDHTLGDENMELVDQMKTFDKIYDELKDEFNQFVKNAL